MVTDRLKQWREEGYLVSPGVFSPQEAEGLRAEGERILAQWLEVSPETSLPGDPDGKCMRHLNHADYHRSGKQGLLAILGLAADERILGLVRELFGEEPLFRCTSLWFHPRSKSEDGNWHRDSQFTIEDEKEEREHILKRSMKYSGIQIQLALLPTEASEYVPRSHLRWDTPEEHAIRLGEGKIHCQSNRMPGALTLGQEPGDLAMFNPMGLHRGNYRSDRPRRTIMLTYTRSSSKKFDYFSDQPWFLEPGYLEGLAAPARRFYERFIEAYRGNWKDPAPVCAAR